MELQNQASEQLREGQRYQFAEPPDDLAAEKAYFSCSTVGAGMGRAYHWLGTVFERRGNIREAEEAYRRAIQLLPSGRHVGTLPSSTQVSFRRRGLD